jgi:hypothetical protein
MQSRTVSAMQNHLRIGKLSQTTRHRRHHVVKWEANEGFIVERCLTTL